MAFKIDLEKCVACGACKDNCPTNAISMMEDGKMVIDPNLCISCGTCQAICPVGAPANEN